DLFVVNAGQRGFWVASMSREEFADISAARLEVEPDALRMSVGCADADWRGAVEAAYQALHSIEASLGENRQGDAPAWERANRAFHDALLSRCPSRWMVRFVDVLAEQSERYRRKALIMHAVPVERLMAEHRAICEAALGGHADLAAELLRVHVAGAAAGIEAKLFGDEKNDHAQY
ncbi:MAG: GntR family transcriptional regulator, partial [Pseudomonadota bacterium]